MRQRNLLLAILLGTVSPVSASAQRGWAFATSEPADLWYHGLALSGYRGFAVLPLYDPDYVERVVAAKQELGIYPTALDRMAGRMLQVLETDSVLDVLHFVPLYFPNASREDMLTAIERVAERRAVPAGLSVRFGAEVLARTITDPAALELLSDFVGALRQEWEVFLEAYRSQTTATYDDGLPEVISFWQFEVATHISQLLGNRRLESGVVFLSPAVGGEGRIFAGDPANPHDNVIIVGRPDAPPDEVAAAVTKEICSPIVGSVVERLGMGRDRTTAERLASIGAVRCGATLFDRFVPDLAERYRAHFVELAPHSTASISFDDLFYLSPRLAVEIDQELPR